MNRIKDLSKIILRTDDLLLKIQEQSRSGIILPDSVKNELPMHGEVIAVGTGVEDIEVGDIIIDVHTQALRAYEIKKDKQLENINEEDNEKYGIISRHSIIIVIKPDNFK